MAGKQGPRGPAMIVISGVEHVTLTELARRKGRHLSHLSRLVREGRLGPGVVRGKIRYVDVTSAEVDMLMSPPKARHCHPWE